MTTGWTPDLSVWNSTLQTRVASLWSTREVACRHVLVFNTVLKTFICQHLKIDIKNFWLNEKLEGVTLIFWSNIYQLPLLYGAGLPVPSVPSRDPLAPDIETQWLLAFFTLQASLLCYLLLQACVCSPCVVAIWLIFQCHCKAPEV